MGNISQHYKLFYGIKLSSCLLLADKLLFKIVMKHERYVPQYISDKIIEDYITTLLSDRKYYPKQPESYKYELTVKDSFWENPFIHEVKKIPHAYSKNIPAQHCVLKYEIMKVTAGKLEVSGITTADCNQKIKVTIPAAPDSYYVEIEAEKLRRLLQKYIVDTIIKPYAGEIKIVAVMVVDKQILMDNCISLRK